MTLLYIFLGLMAAALIAAAAVGIYHRRTDPPNLTEADVLRAVDDGDRTRAMRYYRTIHGAGLRQAKEAVDQLAKLRAMGRAQP